MTLFLILMTFLLTTTGYVAALWLLIRRLLRFLRKNPEAAKTVMERLIAPALAPRDEPTDLKPEDTK